MLELKDNRMVFSFPEVHPSARLTVTLMRTLRIPDDGKKYALPPGLGTFPTRHVDDHKSRLPEKWVKRGGVLVPMYQSEALWIRFSAEHADRGMGGSVPYPFAIKVATGKRSAITGKPWSKRLRESDYVVAPKQPWLDGYVVEGGLVRQFVAAPLGQGFTAEEQITGEAEFGGIQIEAVPMTRECFDRRWPHRPMTRGMADWLHRGGPLGRLGQGGPFGRQSSGVLRSHSVRPSKTLEAIWENQSRGEGDFTIQCSTADSKGASYVSLSDSGDEAVSVNLISELGVAPGGTMEQQVFEDPYGLKDWHKSESTRCFVHLTNSMVWRSVTGQEPPTVPLTAADYTRQGLPWFEHYVEGARVASGTGATSGLKGIAQLEKEKGVKILPENESIKSKRIARPRKAGEVRDGSWK